MSTQRLPAEWEPQDAVMLTWPHQNTAWNWILDEVTELYEALATVIVDYADVIIAVPAALMDDVNARLTAMGAPMEYIHLYACDSDDTWARDHGHGPQGQFAFQLAARAQQRLLLAERAVPAQVQQRHRAQQQRRRGEAEPAHGPLRGRLHGRLVGRAGHGKSRFRTGSR